MLQVHVLPSDQFHHKNNNPDPSVVENFLKLFFLNRAKVFRLYMAGVMVITLLIMLGLDTLGVVDALKNGMHFLFRIAGADERYLPLAAIISVIGLVGALFQIKKTLPKMEVFRLASVSKRKFLD